MLTKEKMLYQVKLILDFLPEEEYRLIPQETIDFIEKNFEYDEKIIINPNISLEEQNIDDQTYKMLDEIVRSAENNKDNSVKEISQNIVDAREPNKEFDPQIENIKLKNIVELLKKENGKIPKAKVLLEEYKIALKQKDIEIERLKENNQNLYECIQKIPRILRRIFIKDNDIKLLINGKS